jgi:aryl-alcohol dehydrogenase-like predicted oxidoreductase
VKIYEESLQDVDWKYYLTATENTGFATGNGTNWFKDRNELVKDHYYREGHGGLLSSVLGIDTQAMDHSWGSYGDFTLYSILKLAAQKGISNTFHTYDHCRGTHSQRIVGAAIDSLIKKYKYSREEFMVINETGALSDDAVSQTPIKLVIEDLIKSGGLKYTDICKANPYCIHPVYLRHQLEKTKTLMGLKTIDVQLLHNPIESMMELDLKEIEYRLARAFEFLESKFSISIYVLFG